MRRTRLIPLLFLLTLTFGIALPTHAQSGSGECVIQYAEHFFHTLDEGVDFETCLNDLYDELLDRNDPDVTGSWRNLDVYITADGDIQTAPANTDNWTYYGSFTSDSGGTNGTQGENSGNSSGSSTAGSSPMTMEEIFTVVRDDLNDFWVGVFQDEGQPYREPDLILWDGGYYRTGCGTASEDTGPFYCPNDHTIYFPVSFSEWLYSMGDFAVAAAIAHEWGHSIQAQLGILGNAMTIDTELQADCLAGAYADYIATRSQRLTLEEGDIDEGANTFFTLGDPDGTPWFDPQAHGTGREREQSFEAGVDQGVGGC